MLMIRTVIAGSCESKSSKMRMKLGIAKSAVVQINQTTPCAETAIVVVQKMAEETFSRSVSFMERFHERCKPKAYHGKNRAIMMIVATIRIADNPRKNHAAARKREIGLRNSR